MYTVDGNDTATITIEIYDKWLAYFDAYDTSYGWTNLWSAYSRDGFSMVGNNVANIVEYNKDTTISSLSFIEAPITNGQVELLGKTYTYDATNDYGVKIRLEFDGSEKTLLIILSK
jgi:hypothetical protein